MHMTFADAKHFCVVLNRLGIVCVLWGGLQYFIFARILLDGHLARSNSFCAGNIYRWVRVFNVHGYLTQKKQRLPLGPYSRAMPRALWWSLGGFLMSEIPLYIYLCEETCTRSGEVTRESVHAPL